MHNQNHNHDHHTISQAPKLDIPSKPNLIKLTEDFDFFGLFLHIEQAHETCFLLESLGEESYISRHHVIGFDPVLTISATDKHTLQITNNRSDEVFGLDALATQTYHCDNPYLELQRITPQHVLSRNHTGGLVGFIGFDGINFFEPSLNVTASDMFEPFKFGVYLDGLSLDKMTGEIYYFYYQENRIEQVRQLLSQTLPTHADPRVTHLGDGMNKEEHAKTVHKVKEDIKAGLIFQCEVGFKSHYRIEGSTLPIYQKLREVNPSPHMYYMKFGEQKIIGASPELLFRLRNGEMETFPLAGTAKRGATKAEDQMLARALLNDPKEIAEHNMLVDLHRNDIGRVARFGTVKVRNLMDIKRYSHVQHISSEIVGILDPKHDMFSALASNFPAGTLSGAPKIEAIKIISEQEPDGRGAYGGALGQFSFNGDCIFAIPIRSLFVHGEKAYAQTSGGNVYDSNPEDEYEEIQRKLSAMRVVLEHFKNIDE